MRRKHIWLLVLSCWLTLAFVTAACGNEGEAPLEERARSIDKSLICPVCPGETIDQAQVELAHQMRAIVREKLAEGLSREQILQFFVDRYGEDVLAAPPKSGFNLIAWVVPLSVVAAAIVLLLLVIKAMRRPAESRQEEGPLHDQELESYLARVDQELGIPQGGSREPEQQGVSDP